MAKVAVLEKTILEISDDMIIAQKQAEEEYLSSLFDRSARQPETKAHLPTSLDLTSISSAGRLPTPEGLPPPVEVPSPRASSSEVASDAGGDGALWTVVNRLIVRVGIELSSQKIGYLVAGSAVAVHEFVDLLDGTRRALSDAGWITAKSREGKINLVDGSLPGYSYPPHDAPPEDDSTPRRSAHLAAFRQRGRLPSCNEPPSSAEERSVSARGGVSCSNRQVVTTSATGPWDLPNVCGSHGAERSSSSSSGGKPIHASYPTKNDWTVSEPDDTASHDASHLCERVGEQLREGWRACWAPQYEYTFALETRGGKTWLRGPMPSPGLETPMPNGVVEGRQMLGAVPQGPSGAILFTVPVRDGRPSIPPSKVIPMVQVVHF